MWSLGYSSETPDFNKSFAVLAASDRTVGPDPSGLISNYSLNGNLVCTCIWKILLE